MNVFMVWFVAGLSQALMGFLRKRSLVKFWAEMCLKRKCLQRVENVEEGEEGYSILDLPELVLEGVLIRLSPSSLCNMAAVCRDLRERCRNNYLWETLLKVKWGKVVGRAAHKEWQRTVAMNKEMGMSDSGMAKCWLGSLTYFWPFSWLKLKPEFNRKQKRGPTTDSLMAWYMALESGKFWFPAQVYNRERGHVGFMLSCYDAKLSYDCTTDTFQARYPPHGARTTVIEDGIHWERLRAPPVDTAAHDLHISDCLNDLHPGDHVEIQWRRNKEFPYGRIGRLSLVKKMVSCCALPWSSSLSCFRFRTPTTSSTLADGSPLASGHSLTRSNWTNFDLSL
ncbi:hypothetical protein KI387_019651 [Taxus chinensis]|uniref:F-box domain-containing protein n=1 Tax=Taxus chinensis TaxID=29808 RepID=A0AA38G8C5_TAXCH|nr:hypothetical protein KI387_019651 [Taxus chinensis]